MSTPMEALLVTTVATPAAPLSSCKKTPRASIRSSDPRLDAGTGGDGQGGAKTPPSPRKRDLSKLAAEEALELLSTGIELLVRLTGDISPTPPAKTPMDPQMSGLRVEKDKMAQSLSQRSLAKLLHRPPPQQQTCPDGTQATKTAMEASREHGHEDGLIMAKSRRKGLNKLQAYSASMTAQMGARQHQVQLMQRRDSHHDQAQYDDHDAELTDAGPFSGSYEVNGICLGYRPPPSPPLLATEQPGPYVVVGADSQPVSLQHGVITRKFYSKKEPPISIAQYLQRLHRFCPMSTAVYLATSLYIHRSAVEERAMAVTRRNAHRLVLAGLRVAMKTLEDRSYTHAKVARVGGVSESELTRLEISFCFLAGFDLVVGEEVLRRHWDALRDGRLQPMLRGLDASALRIGRRLPHETPAAVG